MASACDRLRDQLIDLAGGLAASQDARTHVEACSECRARVERWEAQAQALGSIVRLEAPDVLAESVAGAITDGGRGVRAAAVLGGVEPARAPEALDGRVVAALFAGYRQDRAVRRVKAMPRVETPPPLRRRVEVIAPGEVDLVFEGQLDDPLASAPSTLREGRVPLLVRGLATAVLAAAAALLVWLAPFGSDATSAEVAGRSEPLTLSFDVVRGDAAALAEDDFLRSAGSLVTGGFLEVAR